MNWFWMNIPVAAAFFAAWTGIPLWLVLENPDSRPRSHATLAPPRSGDTPATPAGRTAIADGAISQLILVGDGTGTGRVAAGPRPGGGGDAQVTIGADDPRASDVRALVARHLEFATSHKPPGDIHALDAAGLLDPAVTVFSCRAGGELLAVGALKRLDARHAELKAMHTAAVARGRGIGRAMLAHLIGVARGRGFRRLSLKTGSQPAFAPARSLYASAGFTPCRPFSDYQPSRSSAFMTLSLDGPGQEA